MGGVKQKRLGVVIARHRKMMYVTTPVNVSTPFFTVTPYQVPNATSLHLKHGRCTLKSWESSTRALHKNAHITVKAPHVLKLYGIIVVTPWTTRVH
jgi:hypothetical protein